MIKVKLKCVIAESFYEAHKDIKENCILIIGLKVEEEVLNPLLFQ